MKRLAINMEDAEHQELKEKAVKSGISMRKIVHELIRHWLKKGKV